MPPSRRHMALILPALILAGCDFVDGGSNNVREDFHETHNLPPDSRVEVESYNGSVEIRAWDKESIDISGTKYAPTEQILREIRIQVVPSANSIRVAAARPDVSRRRGGVSFVITVPRKCRLDRVSTSNASIQVTGVEGDGRLRTSNGSIRIHNAKGQIAATTSNARIELSGLSAGGAILNTSNGGIRAEDIRGDLEARTSNGGIEAHVVESGSRHLRAETSNGRIDLRLEAAPKADVVAVSSNGGVTVRLPDPVDARVRAHTSNGSVSSDFPVSGGEKTRTRLEGQIGAGGVLLDLRSSNASIQVKKL